MRVYYRMSRNFSPKIKKRHSPVFTKEWRLPNQNKMNRFDCQATLYGLTESASIILLSESDAVDKRSERYDRASTASA